MTICDAMVTATASKALSRGRWSSPATAKAALGRGRWPSPATARGALAAIGGTRP